jgi:Flp pilus assembly pilin Flp
MSRMRAQILSFAASEDGSSAVEYAVIAVVFTVSLVGYLANFASALSGTITDAATQLSDATAAGSN